MSEHERRERGERSAERGDRERGDRERGDRGDRPGDRGDRPGDRDRGERSFDRDRGERSFDRDRGDRGERSFDRGDRGDRGPRGIKQRLRAKARKKARKSGRRVFLRRKVCRFCADSKVEIDYKDSKVLRFFVTETGKLIPRRISGNCAKHQREVSTAIKRARVLALIPFSVRSI